PHSLSCAFFTNMDPAKDPEKTCVLCCQDVEIFALGKCDHPVCYRCSTKMRVLCEQKYCAVCREELDKVVFVKKLEAFQSLSYQNFPCEKTYDIYFGDEMIYSQYRRLLFPECPRCPEPKIFCTFEELEKHMRKQHELFCCKLCTKHLKIFSHERKWYNRKELARHRAHGDTDDTSHRGHPLCKFCDDRYLDNDELLKHLRRDHYFCHFCDADGSQEYYSDYQYLSEHFRESHYLCEEGRCATEQFTHAFRSEIDYKAHKAAEHSKNRAELRQNRQIELQFNYATRQQRRNEGWLPRCRHVREREEEDRQVEAALRASMAMRRQAERAAVQERSTPKHCREDRVDRTEPEEPKANTGHKTPASVGGAATLKEEEYPSLSAAAVSAPMTPAYSAQPRKTSSFQEEDFPALVPKVRPRKPAASTSSAWSNHTAVAAPITHPPPFSRPTPPVSVSTSGPELLSSSNSVSSRKKKKVGENIKAASRHSPLSDDESSGMTQREFRSVPTMLDISSLLTVKTDNSKSSTVHTTAQKENLPEKTRNKPNSSVTSPAEMSRLANGYPDPPQSVGKENPLLIPVSSTEPPPDQEEEFPALATKKPPPGFRASFPLTASVPPSALPMPPPPPGLGIAAPKPPPGFTGIPLNSNVVEVAPSAVNRSALSSGYLVPDDFQQRNLELIQSIKKYLNNDESKFNQFKNYSAQFRQ
uniref:RING-type E3 ubiquitin transferase n=1 Tax=Oryzias sinensis TaxID=183150 RepID=A0A8C7XAP6_9TELE